MRSVRIGAKILIILVFVLVLSLTLFACGEDTPSATVVTGDATGTVGVTYAKYADGSVEVTGYTGTAPSVVVSAVTTDGDPVTKIAANAFSAKNIVTLTLPPTITELPSNAFADSTALKAVVATGVKTIGENVFKGTKWLEDKPYDSNIYFNNVFCGLKLKPAVGDAPATDASSFKDVVLETTTVSAAIGAFSVFSAMETVSFPHTMYLTGREFDGVSTLKSFSITTGRGTARYWKATDGVLMSYDGKTLVKYPEGKVTENGVYTMPSGINTVESRAIQNTSLTGIVISNSVGLFADYSVFNNKNLTSVTSVSSSAGFKRLGSYVFAGCGKLEELTTSSSLNEIGDYAFAGSSLKNITFRSASAFARIGDYAFKGLVGFTGTSTTAGTLTIPASVTEIGVGAFYNCEGISSLVLGAKVEKIGDLAFYGCSIESAKLNTVLKEIGDSAFYAAGITEIVLPYSLEKIGDSAFASCSSLADISWGAAGNVDASASFLKSIGTYAFSGCLNITEFNLSYTVESVGSYAFKDCAALASVKISRAAGSVVTVCGRYAFDGCAELKAYVPTESLEVYKASEGWQDYADKILPTLLAKDSYTVVFYTNGGGAKDSKELTVMVLKEEDASFVHTKPNYALQGWYYDADFTRPVIFNEGDALMTTSEFTEVEFSTTHSYYYARLYAKWVTYRLEFSTGGEGSATALAGASAQFSGSDIQLTKNEGSTKTFEGWYLDEALTLPVVFAENGIFTPQFIGGDVAYTYKVDHWKSYTYYYRTATLYAKWS